MPFKFTGTLEKVQIKLGPNELTPQQRGELEQLKRDFALAGKEIGISKAQRNSASHCKCSHPKGEVSPT